MKLDRRQNFTFILALLIGVGSTMSVRASELDDLKAQMRVMQETMDQMQKKITHLEQENQKQKQQQQQQVATSKKAPAPPAEGSRPPPPLIDANGNAVVTIAPQTVTIAGHASEVTDRPAVNDQQEPAPRPNDLTLDPKYRGFVPIPNTPVLIKFNAKPRVNFTDDPQNTGNPDRFVTAQIPVDGDFDKGEGNQFNVNSKGSQLSLDVRAPELPGSPRFYYQNDFFGSGSGTLNFRVRQLYGQIFNVVLGQTFSVFEDPDAWPDTVDYEGPNSAIFARRPLVRYQWQAAKNWQLNFGLEKPSSEVDTSIDPDAQQVNHAPDGGLNLRWENSDYGHIQLGAIYRDIGVKGPIVGNQNTFGWGVNLSTSLNVFDRDSIQAQLTYGQGLFRDFNDDFQNNDAVFNSSGNLTA